MRRAGPDGRTLSWPRRLKTADTCRTTFDSNLMSSTVDHGELPSELRGVRTMAKPGCAATQLYSSRLFSTRTRRAFFSSNRFLTDHFEPRQSSRFAKWLRR